MHLCTSVVHAKFVDQRQYTINLIVSNKFHGLVAFISQQAVDKSLKGKKPSVELSWSTEDDK